MKQRDLGGPTDAPLATLLARQAASSSRAAVDLADREDLVLDREELRMLEIFDRSFQLPGLRLGLLNPVCSEDYYPEDEFEADEDAPQQQPPPAPTRPQPAQATAQPPPQRPPQRQPRPKPPPEPSPADELRALLAQTEALKVHTEEVLEEEIRPEAEESGSARPSSGAYVRTVRPHSASSRPNSGRRKY